MARQRIAQQLVKAKTQLIKAQTKQIHQEQSFGGLDSFILGAGVASLLLLFFKH